MGMEYVPVISLSLMGMEKYSGFKVTPAMLYSCMKCIIYGDMLLLLKNQTLPYEINPGDTKRLVDRWIEKLCAQIRKNRGLSKKEVSRNLKAIAADFHSIPVRKKKLKKVGIVGEIYVKYSSFGNNGLEEFLISQGCEVMLPGVFGFFQTVFSNIEIDHHYYGGRQISLLIGKAAEKIACKWENLIEDALKPYPDFETPCSFDRIKALAGGVIDLGVKMGEGWLLPGEAAALIEKGYDNIICAQPFGCLPNHIVGKGTVRKLRELYPDANIFPVDYDAGASRVNQENRIKLMLANSGMGRSPAQEGPPQEREARESAPAAAAAQGVKV
jgi:predicted nucleotide-binding protein (sugar kinase/HSP70/actin superfamily)